MAHGLVFTLLPLISFIIALTTAMSTHQNTAFKSIIEGHAEAVLLYIWNGPLSS